MKLTLENTTKLGFLNIAGRDIPARLWIGKTEKGTECFAFIVRIAVKDGEEAEFERELQEKAHEWNPPPGLPLRLFMD